MCLPSSRTDCAARLDVDRASYGPLLGAAGVPAAPPPSAWAAALVAPQQVESLLAAVADWQPSATPPLGDAERAVLLKCLMDANNSLLDEVGATAAPAATRGGADATESAAERNEDQQCQQRLRELLQQFWATKVQQMEQREQLVAELKRLAAQIEAAMARGSGSWAPSGQAAGGAAMAAAPAVVCGWRRPMFEAMVDSIRKAVDAHKDSVKYFQRQKAATAATESPRYR
eukprot:Selendium_serpulae@DN3119_c0_g1_i2.p1